MSKQQQGMTLVELMISLLLGLSLLAGISELFSHSQKSSKTQRSMSYMMEDGRYALEMMSKELRRTGYLRNSSDPEAKHDKLFIGGSEYMNMLGSDAVTPAISFDQNEIIHGAMRDAFVIRYQLNDSQDLANSNGTTASPCTRDILLGAEENPAIENHIVSIYFFVEPDKNNIPTLYCRARRDVISYFRNAPVVSCVAPANCYDSLPDKLPVITDVEKLIVKYGVNCCTDGQDDMGNELDYGAADYYTDAEQIPENLWKRVVSVKLFLVLRSEEDNMMPNNSSYSIEGETYTAEDKRMYRVFSTTVAFRNQ